MGVEKVGGRREESNKEGRGKKVRRRKLSVSEKVGGRDFILCPSSGRHPQLSPSLLSGTRSLKKKLPEGLNVFLHLQLVSFYSFFTAPHPLLPSILPVTLVGISHGAGSPVLSKYRWEKSHCKKRPSRIESKEIL